MDARGRRWWHARLCCIWPMGQKMRLDYPLLEPTLFFLFLSPKLGRRWNPFLSSSLHHGLDQYGLAWWISLCLAAILEWNLGLGRNNSILKGRFSVFGVYGRLLHFDNMCMFRTFIDILQEFLQGIFVPLSLALNLERVKLDLHWCKPFVYLTLPSDVFFTNPVIP